MYLWVKIPKFLHSDDQQEDYAGDVYIYTISVNDRYKKSNQIYMLHIEGKASANLMVGQTREVDERCWVPICMQSATH